MSINLEAILKGGLAGICLGLLTISLIGSILYFIYKAMDWNPILGFSTATTGGNAVATPAAIAAVSPNFSGMVNIAYGASGCLCGDNRHPHALACCFSYESITKKETGKHGLSTKGIDILIIKPLLHRLLRPSFRFTLWRLGRSDQMQKRL